MEDRKFIAVPVEILIEEGSDLHKRLLKLSEVQKSTFEETVSQVVTMGIWGHMGENCSIYENLLAKKMR